MECNYRRPIVPRRSRRARGAGYPLIYLARRDVDESRSQERILVFLCLSLSLSSSPFPLPSACNNLLQPAMEDEAGSRRPWLVPPSSPIPSHSIGSSTINDRARYSILRGDSARQLSTDQSLSISLFPDLRLPSPHPGDTNFYGLSRSALSPPPPLSRFLHFSLERWKFHYPGVEIARGAPRE